MQNYSGDLNSKLVQYSNCPKQFAYPMVSYSSHVLNRELIVFYLNGKKFGNRMAFCNRTFHLGRQLNGPDHSISDHLNNKQVKVCFSDSHCTLHLNNVSTSFIFCNSWLWTLVGRMKFLAMICTELMGVELAITSKPYIKGHKGQLLKS